MPKTRVDVEDIRELLRKIGEFNKMNLDDIELYQGGEPIEIPPACLEEWKFMGLSNKDFVRLEFWSYNGEDNED